MVASRILTTRLNRSAVGNHSRYVIPGSVARSRNDVLCGNAIERSSRPPLDGHPPQYFRTRGTGIGAGAGGLSQRYFRPTETMSALVSPVARKASGGV